MSHGTEIKTLNQSGPKIAKEDFDKQSITSGGTGKKIQTDTKLNQHLTMLCDMEELKNFHVFVADLN
jgi:hypothetical protein